MRLQTGKGQVRMMHHPSSEQPHPIANVFLIAGFLGSGKTTLLKRILSWQADLSDTVVLVNEFGKVGIDGNLLKNAGSDVIELTSGCICCTLKTELEDTLINIWERFHPKRILLEATGVAQPGGILNIVQGDELKNRMQIEKVVTVLDIRYWINRDNFGQFFMKQIQEADLILLNKVDRVAKNTVKQSLRQFQESIPGCLAVPTVYCQIDPEVLWTRPHPKTGGVGIFDFYKPVVLSETGHDNAGEHIHADEYAAASDGGGYVTFDFSTSDPVNELSFNRFLESLPWQVLRIKGPVKFPDRTVLLNFVAGESNWEIWEGAPETRLAIVGWEMNMDKLVAQFQRCLNPDI